MRRFPFVALAIALALATLAPAPAAAETSYTVAYGDTLWSIADSHGTTVSEIARANNIADPNLIYAGQQLTIPGQAPAPAVPPAAPPPEPSPQPAPVPPAAPGSILGNRMIVSYYGNPYTGVMGVLGQLSKAALVAELKYRATQYQAASGRPVQPAIHFVATVAQASPGADNMYRARMPMDLINEYAQLAADNDMLFIIDVQFGRSTVQAELAPYLDLLRRPYVHLAMDPEFDMWGSERPGVDLGHMTAEEINYAQSVLARIVEDNNLPNKILMVYQFTASMLPDKSYIQSDPRVDLVVNMDGFGGQGIKIEHYNWYVRDTPVEYAGIKLFLEHDTNLMTAKEVMGLTPPPDFVVYQ